MTVELDVKYSTLALCAPNKREKLLNDLLRAEGFDLKRKIHWHKSKTGYLFWQEEQPTETLLNGIKLLRALQSKPQGNA